MFWSCGTISEDVADWWVAGDGGAGEATGAYTGLVISHYTLAR